MLPDEAARCVAIEFPAKVTEATWLLRPETKAF